MLYENNGIFVDTDASGSFVVFRPSDSGTHSVSDSRYASGPDGLSLAICRALYLADGPRRGQAMESVRLANEILSKAKSKAKTMRDALASFDAEFGI